MKLFTSNRCYALNDRTIDLLMKGDIDMSATVGEGEEEISESDVKAQKILETESEVEIFVVDKNKTRSGGAFFNCLNNTLFDFEKYGVFNIVDRNNYKHNLFISCLRSRWFIRY